MSQIDAPQPARRADARRNRDKILTAARAAFAQSDTGISMAEISRRAGVGMATLYRNFPGRLELLEALYFDEVDAFCQAAETIDAGSPGEVLIAWLRAFLHFITSKHPVGLELLKQTGGDASILGRGRARVLATGRPLLLAAQRSGEVRDTLTLEQIIDLLLAIRSIQGDPGYREPILQAALDGLRPGG